MKHLLGRTMRRLSLGGVVHVAWIVMLWAFLLLPAIDKSDPSLVVRILYFVMVPATLLALPVAVIGSLLLAFRRLIQPPEEDAADYDDERKTEPGVKPGSRK
jgi:hypothetical protein